MGRRCSPPRSRSASRCSPAFEEQLSGLDLLDRHQARNGPGIRSLPAPFASMAGRLAIWGNTSMVSRPSQRRWSLQGEHWVRNVLPDGDRNVHGLHAVGIDGLELERERLVRATRPASTVKWKRSTSAISADRPRRRSSIFSGPRRPWRSRWALSLQKRDPRRKNGNLAQCSPLPAPRSRLFPRLYQRPDRGLPGLLILVLQFHPVGGASPPGNPHLVDVAAESAADFRNRTGVRICIVAGAAAGRSGWPFT